MGNQAWPRSWRAITCWAAATSPPIYLDGPTISRRHARLQLAHGHGILEDLGSRHGTFVNGEKLTGPQRLDDGAEFSLGSVVLTLRVLRAHDPVDTR